MEIVSVKQVAAALRTSHDTVVRMIRAKQLEGHQLRDRSRWQINKQSVEAYAKQRGIPLTWPQQNQ
jgi:excisionase family DNA binding protein